VYGTVFDARVGCFGFRDEEILQSSESYRNRLLSDVSLVSRPNKARTQSMSFYVGIKYIIEVRLVLLVQQCRHRYHRRREHRPQ